MKVTIHARYDDASALALAGLIAVVRPTATIDFAAPGDESSRGSPNGNLVNGASVLSVREALLMNRLSDGRSVQECADELNVSPATVQVYAARARSKLAAS